MTSPAEIDPHTGDIFVRDRQSLGKSALRPLAKLVAGPTSPAAVRLTWIRQPHLKAADHRFEVVPRDPEAGALGRHRQNVGVFSVSWAWLFDNYRSDAVECISQTRKNFMEVGFPPKQMEIFKPFMLDLDDEDATGLFAMALRPQPISAMPSLMLAAKNHLLMPPASSVKTVVESMPISEAIMEYPGIVIAI